MRSYRLCPSDEVRSWLWRAPPALCTPGPGAAPTARPCAPVHRPCQPCAPPPLPQHYLPTLLAFHNRSQECDCALGNATQNGPTFTGWWEWGEHPHTFAPAELNATLLHWLRREPAYMREQTLCGDAELEAAEASYEAAFAPAAAWEPPACRTAVLEAAAALRPLPRLRIPEPNWRCMPGHHWSHMYPGKRGGGGRGRGLLPLPAARRARRTAASHRPHALSSLQASAATAGTRSATWGRFERRTLARPRW